MFEFKRETEIVTIFSDFIRQCTFFDDGVGEYHVQQIPNSGIVALAYNLSETSKRQIIDEFYKLFVNYRFNVPDITFKPYEYDNCQKLERVEEVC